MGRILPIPTVGAAGGSGNPSLSFERLSGVKTAPAVLALLSLLAAACAGAAPVPPTSPPTTGSLPDGGEPFVAGELIGLDLPRDTANPSSEAVASVVAGDRALGLDLLAQVGVDENVMLSPYSIATALSIVYAGARGTTAEEMADVLHLQVDDETLHIVRNYLDVALAKATWVPPDEEDTRDPFVIRPANSAWGQGGYPFLDSYLEGLSTYYGAGLHVANFASDPEGGRDLINHWTADATEGRIEELVPPGIIDRLTRLVLVNAIWFRANWENQFDPTATVDRPFTRLDGSEVALPMMHSTALRTGYVANDLFTAVRLPYTGEAAMVIALPAEGSPADLAAAMDPEAFEIAWEDHLVDVTLPRFEFRSELRLKDSLEALGMREAFVPPDGVTGADFTGMIPDRLLYVKEALHQSFVAVDEHGTEAAAATAVIMQEVSAPMPATFSADRPFLFWIEHIPTGEALFLGQVVDPT